MYGQFSVNKLPRVILLLLVCSWLSTFLALSFNTANAHSEIHVSGGSHITEGIISMLGEEFSSLVGIGGSPFIALTILSGVGSFLNSGKINPDILPFSDSLMSLPIANTGIFTILLIITIVKFLTSMLGVSKVLCDATLGKIENMIGTVCSVGGAFLLTSVTAAYAAEFASASTISVGAGIYLLTNVVAFLSAVFAFAVYTVTKTMLTALDVLAFLFSPLPGSTAFFTIAKHIILGTYMWVSVTNPAVSMVVGAILVIIACFVFRAAKRLELYYRKIYLVPFVNALFRRGHRIPIIPKKLPRGVAAEFSEIDMCIEGFFMNRTSNLYKRELCYFIKSGETNYIFKKRLFGKTIKFEIPSDTFIEKPFIFRFLRIFSDEALRANQRRVNLVIRREHGKDINKILSMTGLIDYNALLEERRRKKAEEMALKAQQMKAQAAEKFASVGKKIKGTFGGMLSGKHKSEKSES